MFLKKASKSRKVLNTYLVWNSSLLLMYQHHGLLFHGAQSRACAQARHEGIVALLFLSTSERKYVCSKRQLLHFCSRFLRRWALTMTFVLKRTVCGRTRAEPRPDQTSIVVLPISARNKGRQIISQLSPAAATMHHYDQHSSLLNGLLCPHNEHRWGRQILW